MMIAQIEKPVDRLFIVGRELTNGSSPLEIMMVFLGVAVFFLLLYVLFRLQIRSRRKFYDNPARLFRDLILKMNLSVRHRDLVRRIANDLNMDNPSIMFLTPELFAAIGEKWLLRNPDLRENKEPDLQAIRHFLFPDRPTHS